VGPVDLPINQKLDPPIQLIDASALLQGSEFLKVNILEVDGAFSSEGIIIAWKWRPSPLDNLAVNKSTGPIRLNFGFGQQNPTQESGFEGFVIVNAKRIS
jgi:hypothetical protein